MSLALERTELVLLGLNVREVLVDGDWHLRRARDDDANLRELVMVTYAGDVQVLIVP